MRYFRRRRRRYGKLNAKESAVALGCMFFVVAIPAFIAAITSIFMLISENIDTMISILIFIVGIVLSITVFVAVNSHINKRYTAFVLSHSKAVNTLKGINSKYTFYSIPNFDISQEYDNVNFYDDVTPRDRLIYELQYKKDNVLTAIDNTNKNKTVFRQYKGETDHINCFDEYGTAELPFFRSKLARIERKIYNSLILQATTNFQICVRIILTNINGELKNAKKFVFPAEQIPEIIEQMKQDNGRYNDEIWQSICRVERAKVSNKMRFAIYNRDGNRCRKCGSTRNLEIDHIFPISRGGKSEYSNLQTLCHQCNTQKSNTIEKGVADPRVKKITDAAFCPHCGGALVVKNGNRGKFLGCSNYRTTGCRYTKNI